MTLYVPLRACFHRSNEHAILFKSNYSLVVTDVCYLSDSISAAVGKEVHDAVTLPGKEETVFQFVAHLKRDQSQYVME